MYQIDPVLSQTFFFDAVDVAANRSGRLSPDQEQGFRQMAARSRRAVPRLIVLTAGAVIGSLVLASFMPGAGGRQLLIAAGALAACFGVIVLIIRLNATSADRYQAAADQPVVKIAEGQPSEHWNTTSDIRSLVVAGVRFPMMWDDIAKFHAERTYRVYYAELGNKAHMLSVEVVH